MKDHHGAYCKAKCHWFKDLNLQKVLSPGASGFTGSKVVATIGPACHDVDTLKGLLQAGAVGARVDLTWGPLEFHRRSLYNLQMACRETRRLCCSVVDTLGRELMIRRQVTIDENGWPIHEASLEIKAGQEVTITTRLGVEATSSCLPITYEGFTDMAMKGDTIYIGRYLVCGADSASLYLEVQEVKGPDVICIAKNDAVLDGLLTVFHAERSSDTLENVQNQLPLLSAYDKECIELLSRDFELDFISLSYTRSAEDVMECRSFLDSVGCVNTKILAKIETRQALLNFPGILSEADGVIISRGNLGLDCVPEKMALIQKTLIQSCNIVGKPVLLTRVVDTMVTAPRPTRAEATDVANAVLDGVDGILLGAETLRGRYPVQTVTTICSICRSAEAVFDSGVHFEHLMEAAMDTDHGFELPHHSHHGGLHRQHTWDSDDGLGEKGTKDDGESDSSDELTSSEPGALHETALLESSLAASKDNSAVDLKAAGAKAKGKVDSQQLLDLGSHAMPSMSKQAPSAVVNKVAFGASVGTSAGVHKLSELALAGRATVDKVSQEARKANAHWGTPYLSKLESIASSAVRAADKVRASLIICYTHTGTTAQLVAKYRPPMPILTLVVPHLTSNGLKWQLEGRSYARQCLLSRGLLPTLAAPSSHGEEILEEAVTMAARMGLVKAHDFVVCVQRVHEDFCVKILSVDAEGLGIKRLDPMAEGPAAHGEVDTHAELLNRTIASTGSPLSRPTDHEHEYGVVPGGSFLRTTPHAGGSVFSTVDVQPTKPQPYTPLARPADAPIVTGGMTIPSTK